jgi:hypothetical protein
MAYKIKLHVIFSTVAQVKSPKLQMTVYPAPSLAATMTSSSCLFLAFHVPCSSHSLFLSLSLILFSVPFALFRMLMFPLSDYTCVLFHFALQHIPFFCSLSRTHLCFYITLSGYLSPVPLIFLCSMFRYLLCSVRRFSCFCGQSYVLSMFHCFPFLIPCVLYSVL